MSRGGVAAVLAVLGGLLAGPAVAAYALDWRISDQARYLEAVDPLADDPVVRRAVSQRVTDAISARLGPGNLQLPDSARGIVSASVAKVVDSDGFRRAWSTANRVAHPEVIAMLRGEASSLRIDGDTVLLELGVVVDEVRARLVADGVPLADRLPDVSASIPLVSRPAIRRAVPAYDTLRALNIVLPVAVGALLAAALMVSSRRARTLVVAGAVTGGAMLLLALYQWIARGQVVSTSRSPELAGAFYDALTGYLTTMLWLVFGLAAAATLGGLLAQFARRRRAAQARVHE